MNEFPEKFIEKIVDAHAHEGFSVSHERRRMSFQKLSAIVRRIGALKRFPGDFFVIKNGKRMGKYYRKKETDKFMIMN